MTSLDDIVGKILQKHEPKYGLEFGSSERRAREAREAKRRAKEAKEAHRRARKAIEAEPREAEEDKRRAREAKEAERRAEKAREAERRAREAEKAERRARKAIEAREAERRAREAEEAEKAKKAKKAEEAEKAREEFERFFSDSPEICASPGTLYGSEVVESIGIVGLVVFIKYFLTVLSHVLEKIVGDIQKHHDTLSDDIPQNNWDKKFEYEDVNVLGFLFKIIIELEYELPEKDFYQYWDHFNEDPKEKFNILSNSKINISVHIEDEDWCLYTISDDGMHFDNHYSDINLRVPEIYLPSIYYSNGKFVVEWDNEDLEVEEKD